jgi:hypothetical protein
MRRRLAILLLLALGAAPARALDVSGNVVDKLEEPIAGASVCLENVPSHCVTTDADGAFRITDASSLEKAPPRPSFTLELRGTRLLIGSPVAGNATVAWFDCRGRSLAPLRRIHLRPGPNPLDPPEASPGGGLHLLRVSAEGRSAMWKTVLLDGRGRSGSARDGRAREARADGRVSALSKTAIASTDLIVTKEGYRRAEYRPQSETETGATIVLTRLEDSGFVFTSRFTAGHVRFDREEGVWITESTVDTCEGNMPVRVTVRDTSRFAVREGRLLRWYQGECVGDVLTGGSDDATGSWTLVEADYPLPGDLRPEGCDPDTIISQPVPDAVDAVLEITPERQVFDLTVEICPTDLYVPIIGMFLLQDTTVELVSNTCRRAEFRNGAGEDGVLSFEKRGDSLASSFTHNTTTCAMTEMMRQGDGVPPDCSGLDPTFRFLDCIAGTGYFGEAGPVTEPAAAKPGSRRISTGASVDPREARAWSGLLRSPRARQGRCIFLPYHGRPSAPARQTNRTLDPAFQPSRL